MGMDHIFVADTNNVESRNSRRFGHLSRAMGIKGTASGSGRTERDRRRPAGNIYVADATGIESRS